MPGGVQVHVRELAARLRTNGHVVLIVAPSRNRMEDEDGLAIAGRAVPIPYQGTVAPIALPPSGSLGIRRALSRFRPEVVHAHEPLVPSLSAVTAMLSKAPAVATFHAHVERSKLFDLAAPLVKPVWRRLAVRIAVSEAARSFLSSRLDGEVRVIPNGVDVQLFRGAKPAGDLPEGRRIGWVSRLDRQKGFPVALQAFSQLASEWADLHLVVAGDGRDRAAVETLPGAIRSRVVMLGAVPHDRLPPYLAACDVFVAAATGQESFGVVLVEAMAAGLPVVATDIAGYREVVRDGIDGILVPPSDAGALANGLGRVLRDHRLARRLAEEGRARAGEFSWEAVTPRIEEAYWEALRR
jgi:phosphatidylinositol alpha-mannosyltransferase